MAVSDQTRSGDLAETFKSERETTKNQIRVALPGIIQSFDPDAVTAVVQPAIRSVEKDNDGNRITKNYPLLVDVPVVLPASVVVGVDGTVMATATCSVSGAVAALAGTITEINTPTRGWVSVTNPAAATVGSPAETDAELRIRQSQSVALPSIFGRPALLLQLWPSL